MACTRASRAAAATAAAKPSQGLWVWRPTANPVTAPTAIIPSTPRFMMPARSARISPSVPKSRGVLAAMLRPITDVRSSVIVGLLRGRDG